MRDPSALWRKRAVGMTAFVLDLKPSMCNVGTNLVLRSFTRFDDRVQEGARLRMDMTWVTGRIAVGGGIWNAENMAKVSRAGVTHIVDMQIEFDDTALAEVHGIEVLWNPIDDDFAPKDAGVFEKGVAFARTALDEPGTKIYIHCAAGVHRAPMM